MTSHLTENGYVLNGSLNIWSRPGYGGINYSDGDETELRIAHIIRTSEDLSILSPELRKHCTDWPSLYHLSGTRANILRPFSEHLSGDILEIGAGCGAITRYLGECGATVLALEGSPRRASIARDRTRDLSNVTVLAEKFDLFQSELRFDVITLIGVLEYANLFTDETNSPLALLTRVRSLLKPEGRLIIAIENQLGLKYFAGALEDHIGIAMYGIENRYQPNQAVTFGKTEIREMLCKAGFITNEFLAPFPDYKLPASIITEQGATTKAFDAAALAAQSVKKDPQLSSQITFSPELVWPTIFKNDLAIDMANSFLIISSMTDPVLPPELLAFHYSTERAPEYCKETLFKLQRDNNVRLEYHALHSTEQNKKSHSEKVINFRLPTPETYTEGRPLAWELLEIVTRDGWQISDAASFVKRYVSILNLIAQDRGLNLNSLDSDTILPEEFFDIVPQNIIIKPSGTPVVIDTEWSLNGGIELGMLLFRSLLLTMQYITRFGDCTSGQNWTRGGFVRTVLSEAGYVLTESDIARYMTIDTVIQKQITQIEVPGTLDWYPNLPLQTTNLVYTNSHINLKSKIQKFECKEIKLREQLDDLTLIKIHQENQITDLKNSTIYYESKFKYKSYELEQLLSSRSWKMTAPLRFVGSRLRQLRKIFGAIKRRVQAHGGVVSSLNKIIKTLQKEGIVGIRMRFQSTTTDIAAATNNLEKKQDYAEWIQQYDTLTTKDEALIRKEIEEMKNPPSFSILMPTYNANATWLLEAIKSVQEQLYPHWDLCIADDASTDPAIRSILEQVASEDNRIRVVFREKNGHISAASNSALQLATGDWITLLDHDDLLPIHALYYCALTAQEDADTDIIYSDEDKLDSSGERCHPFFKPEWSPQLALSQAYLGHLICFKANKLRDNLYFDEHLNGAQDFDLWLRCAAQNSVVKHIPKILYHWREHQHSTAANANSKPYANEAGRLAVARCVSTKYADNTITVKTRDDLFTYELNFELPVDTLISIIIPTKDKIDLLSTCINSIFNKSDWKNIEIIIIDNQSIEAESKQYFQDISNKKSNVKVVEADIPFNWSKLNNIGTKVAAGNVLLFLNNDTEVISPNWLRSLAGYALLPDVGVVGGLLKYPDGTIQHSGVVVGMGGWADHVFKSKYAVHFGGGPFVSPVLTRNVLAVTGACMAVTKEKFEQLGGFDESFIICGSDVELCLRAHKNGLFNVMCGEAILYHYESKTRTAYIPEEDFLQSEVKYAPYRGDVTDPYFNKNLSLSSTDPTLAFGPRHA